MSCKHCKGWGQTITRAENICAIACPECKRLTWPNEGVNFPVGMSWCIAPAQAMEIVKLVQWEENNNVGFSLRNSWPSPQALDLNSPCPNCGQREFVCSWDDGIFYCANCQTRTTARDIFNRQSLLQIKQMFKLHINPSALRKWRIECESENSGKTEAVVYAYTFMDALHDWWQGDSESFPNDIPIELGNCLGGTLTLYIENDVITIWDCSDEDDPNLISAADLIERRKQKKLQSKGKV